MNQQKIIVCFILSILMLFGCDDPVHTQTRTETNVNVTSYLMDTDAFALDLLVAKLKDGSLQDAKDMEKFINSKKGINNVDLDKDGNLDELTVKEEGKDGKIAMAIIAHPKSGEETTVAEVGFEKNVTTGEVQVSGAYPSYVNGYNDHYYNHTLTGSVIGDMMFYQWMFNPHPLYTPSYHYGMYYSSPRPVIVNKTVLVQGRNSYRKSSGLSTVKSSKLPSTYSPKTSSTKKSVTAFNKSSAAKKSSSLSSKSGKSSTFATKSSSKTSAKKSSFGSKSSSTKSKSSFWGSSRKSSSSSWGSSRSSFRSSRKSNAQYKHNITYLSSDELNGFAQQCYDIPLALWNYNDDVENDNRMHLGIITQDFDDGSAEVAITSDYDQVDLYGYTSLAIAGVQANQNRVLELERELQELKKLCSHN